MHEYPAVKRDITDVMYVPKAPNSVLAVAECPSVIAFPDPAVTAKVLTTCSYGEYHLVMNVCVVSRKKTFFSKMSPKSRILICYAQRVCPTAVYWLRAAPKHRFCSFMHLVGA